MFIFYVIDVVCLLWFYDFYNKKCDGKVELIGWRYYVIYKFEIVLC